MNNRHKWSEGEINQLIADRLEKAFHSLGIKYYRYSEDTHIRRDDVLNNRIQTLVDKSVVRHTTPKDDTTERLLNALLDHPGLKAEEHSIVIKKKRK